MNYEEIVKSIQTFVWAALGVGGLWLFKKSIDENKDGRLSFKAEIIPFWGMMLLTYMVIRQGQSPETLYSDTVWVMMCLLTITEAVIRFTTAGGLKSILTKKDDFQKDIMEP